MHIFSGSSNEPLAKAVAEKLSRSLSPIELHTFPDGEKRVKVSEDVVGQDCVVIESTSPPVDINCMELFFIIDALKRTGARSVTAVVPYFGYERQDHVFRAGEARSLEVVIDILELLKVDKLISFDFHTIKIPELFTIPVTHLSALPIFAEKIKQEGWNSKDTILVSPDMGGINRIEKLAELLGGMSHAAVEKNRDLVSGSIESHEIHGEVSGKKKAVIVDDIAASGKTLAVAADLLVSKGIEEVYAMVTHPVFSPEAPSLLQDSKISKVYVTDTIHLDKEKRFDKLEILSVAPQVADIL